MSKRILSKNMCGLRSMIRGNEFKNYYIHTFFIFILPSTWLRFYPSVLIFFMKIVFKNYSDFEYVEYEILSIANNFPSIY